MAAPATPILDNFNRANGGLGANWNGPAIHTGILQISTNAVTGDPATFANSFWVAAGALGPVNTGRTIEEYFQCALLGGPAHNFGAILVDNPVGTLAASKGYAYIFNNTNTGFYRIDPGGSILIGSVNPTSFATGDWAWMVYRPGGICELWRSTDGTTWSLVATNTDATYVSVPLYIGVQIDDNTVKVDNFGGGLIPVAVTRGQQYKNPQAAGIDMRTMQRASHASVANGAPVGGAGEGTLTVNSSPAGVLGTGANADLWTPAQEAV